MQEFIADKIFSYCLIKVNDIKLLVNYFNIINIRRTALINKEKKQNFDEYYEYVTNLYFEKKNKIDSQILSRRL